MENKYRIRSLGGTLLVIKGLNDCITIERNKMSLPEIVEVEGEWSGEEKSEAIGFWEGSDAQLR